MRRLGEVQAALGKSLEEMVALVDSTLHIAPYTKDELASILSISIGGEQERMHKLMEMFSYLDYYYLFTFFLL